MAKDIKFNIIDGNFRILSLCLYFCGRVGVLLAPFHFAVHSLSPAAGCLCNLSLCLYFCGWVGILLAPFHFAAHSHPPAAGYLTTLPQYAQQVVLFIFIPSAYKSLLLTLPDKNKAGLCPAYCFCCDPVGIRTQDPQLRRLLLYPAELPDLSRFNLTRVQI